MNIQYFGTTAEFHLLKYHDKLARRPHDCGIDLFPSGIQTCDTCGYGRLYTINTGFYIILSPGYYGRLVERSSTIQKLPGARVIPGTIDAGYDGELLIRVFSESSLTLTDIQKCIARREAIAQVIPTVCGEFHLVPRPLETRGSSGFGSTDHLKANG